MITLDELITRLQWEGEVVCVTGGRNFSNDVFLYSALTTMHARNRIKCLTNGAYRGADALSRKWAERNRVPYLPFYADWQSYGGAAGPRRNQQMLTEASPDVVLAFSGDTGTANCIRVATNMGIRVIDLRGEEF